MLTFSDIIQSNTPQVNLGNAPSWAQEAANMKKRQFSFKITNSTDNDEVVAYCPSYFPQLTNQLATGQIGGNEGLIGASTSPKTIEQWLAEIFNFPTRVLITQIASQNPNTFDGAITIQPKSTFGTPEAEVIGLSAFKDLTALNATFIRVNTQYLACKRNEISLLVPKRIAAGNNTVVSVTVFCGAQWDECQALQRIADLAYSDPATAQVAAQYLN